MSKNNKTTAYTAIVPPKLEYICATWDPYLQKDIALLVRGSRKKRHSFAPTSIVPQPALLKCFKIYVAGWTSLELRTITRLNLLYQMIHEQIDVDVNNYLKPHSEVRT